MIKLDCPQISKYELIRSSLQENKNIVLVKEKRDLTLPDMGSALTRYFNSSIVGKHGEKIDLFTAPKEPTYNINFLNKIMTNITPIKPDETNLFRKSGPYKGHIPFHWDVQGPYYKIEYGYLRFREKIGSFVYELEINDDSISSEELAQRGFSGNSIILTQPVKRVIDVHLYPHIDIATAVGLGNAQIKHSIYDLALNALKDGMSIDDVIKNFG